MPTVQTTTHIYPIARPLPPGERRRVSIERRMDAAAQVRACRDMVARKQRELQEAKDALDRAQRFHEDLVAQFSQGGR